MGHWLTEGWLVWTSIPTSFQNLIDLANKEKEIELKYDLERNVKLLNFNKGKINKNLYVIGESHSLTSHHLCIQNLGVNFFCSAKLIKGCKQWHLGNAFRNQYKHNFETIFFRPSKT